MGSAYVIGLGRSGLAAARLLKGEGFEVTLSDRNPNAAPPEQQQQLAQAGITVSLGETFDPAAWAFKTGRLRPKPDLVVVSPGVPWDLSGLEQARSLGWDMVGELELAWRFSQEIPWLAITGTNGKTTTTALVEAIFKAAGKQAPACGNIGYAACDGVADWRHQGQPLDWVIAEMSSYQIEAGRSVKPQIAIWTTLTPDHLSRHYTVENYASIKAHLIDQAQFRILNGDDPYIRQHYQDRWPDACWTSTQGQAGLPAGTTPGVYLDAGWVTIAGQRLLAADRLKMQGAHNQQNLLMAVAAAHLAGIEPEAIAAAMDAFPGVPHRLESICQWKGIKFINDSKATNYDAAEVGLRSVEAPAVLLAGGESKAGEDQGWLAQIEAKAVAVVLFGAAAAQFAERLRSRGYTAIECCDTLDQAVPQAAALAAAQGAKTVLLSPACASFDQYENFEQRGDHFRQICLSSFSPSSV